MITITLNNKGASLVEYGMLVGLIAVFAISAISSFGAQNKNTLDVVNNTLSSYVLNGTEIESSAIGGVPQETVSECYDPVNVNSIGLAGWTGCEGMLIVDNAMLDSAASSQTSGDESYDLLGPDGQTYTFANSTHNIFTGQVTDMLSLFRGTSFNGDIGYWDTSNVNAISLIFFGNTSFNQDISGWDLSNVTHTSSAFRGATSFNQDIGNWNVSSLEHAGFMFYGASSFNQDLSEWCVPSLPVEPASFDDGAGFDGNLALHPNWGTCP